MSPEVSSGPQWTTRVYYTTALVGLTLLTSMSVWRPLTTRDDFWNHAAVGRWICDASEVPRATLHVWTAQEPHIYHSWLSQVVFHGLTRLVPPEDLPATVLGFGICAVVASFAVLWLIARRCGGDSTWFLFGLLLAVEASTDRFQVRPDLFTSLLLSILLAFLVSWSRSSAPSLRRMAVLILIFILFHSLWANLHGAVAFGLLLLGLTAICDFLQDRRDSRSRRLGLLTLAAAFGVCINPYGWEYWTAYPSVRSDVFHHISEWAPIWSQRVPVNAPTVIRVGLLAALALAAWSMNPHRRWAHLAWLVVFLALYAQARRNSWPCCAVSLAILAANASAFSFENAPARLRRMAARIRLEFAARVRWLVRFGALILIGNACINQMLRIESWRPLGPADFERGIIRFMRSNRLEGRLFHSSEVVSYLQWRLNGEPPLYFDIINAYPVTVIRNYLEIARCTERGRRLLDEQGIEIVVLSSDRNPSEESLGRLADYLDDSPEWCRVHVSRSGMIWVRRNVKFESIWKPREKLVHPVRFATLEAFQSDREKLFTPLMDDMDREHGRQPPPRWELFDRLR